MVMLCRLLEHLSSDDAAAVYTFTRFFDAASIGWNVQWDSYKRCSLDRVSFNALFPSISTELRSE